MVRVAGVVRMAGACAGVCMRVCVCGCVLAIYSVVRMAGVITHAVSVELSCCAYGCACVGISRR